MDKSRQIQNRIEEFDQRLANAEAYLSRGENIEGTGFLHFDDWKGNSGHPLWIRNVMIPRTTKKRAQLERTLESIAEKERQIRRDRRGRRKSGQCEDGLGVEGATP